MEQKTIQKLLPEKQAQQGIPIQKTLPRQGALLSTNSQAERKNIQMAQQKSILQEKIRERDKQKKILQEKYWKAVYKVKWKAFEEYCNEQDGDNPYTTEEDDMDETEDDTSAEEEEWYGINGGNRT